MSLPKGINTKHMSEQEWLDLRTNSIGGSDAGAILGFNKYASAYSLYWDKVEPENNKQDLSDNDAIHFGNVLEDIVAKEFAERTGKKVRKHNTMMFHPDYAFMSANVDRVVMGEKAILECKTANEFKKSEWQDDNIPASYMAQCYHYLAVTGYDRAYIAVLIGGQTFVWRTIERDEEIINAIIEAEKDFWHNHVEKRIPPKADDSKATADALNGLYRETTESELTLDEQQSTLFKALISIKRQIDELNQTKRGYENQLKEILGEYEKGATSDYKATWKPQKSKRIDTKRLKKERPEIFEQYAKESSSRPLKISEL